jgi:RNA polymerase sigma-70 factor (ECF subfamily)
MEPVAGAKRCLLDNSLVKDVGRTMGNDKRRQEFEALVRPHLDGLYRRAYRFTGHSQDAEDLVQELLLRLYRGPQDLRRIKELRPWLLRALHNLFVDQWRHRGRTPWGHLHPAPWDELLANEAEGGNPEQDAHTVELRRQVLAALYRLSRKHRALLVLHDMEGRSLPELAELLHLPLGTLKSRLFRARRKLRAALDDRNLSTPADVISNEAPAYEL